MSAYGPTLSTTRTIAFRFRQSSVRIMTAQAMIGRIFVEGHIVAYFGDALAGGHICLTLLSASPIETDDVLLAMRMDDPFMPNIQTVIVLINVVDTLGQGRDDIFNKSPYCGNLFTFYRICDEMVLPCDTQVQLVGLA